MRRFFRLIAVLSVVVAAFWLTQLAMAYVEAPMSLGAIVAQSTNIVLMRVESVDKDKNIIIYRKVRDIKGKHPQDVIKHNIGKGGLRPNEWKPQMDWAEPGKTAIFFYQGGASETCIGNWWYQAYGGGEWRNHSHGEPFLLRSFAGNPDKLAGISIKCCPRKSPRVHDRQQGRSAQSRQDSAAQVNLSTLNPKRDFLGGGRFSPRHGIRASAYLARWPRRPGTAIGVVDSTATAK